MHLAAVDPKELRVYPVRDDELSLREILKCNDEWPNGWFMSHREDSPGSYCLYSEADGGYHKPVWRHSKGVSGWDSHANPKMVAKILKYVKDKQNIQMELKNLTITATIDDDPVMVILNKEERGLLTTLIQSTCGGLIKVAKLDKNQYTLSKPEFEKKEKA